MAVNGKHEPLANGKGEAATGKSSQVNGKTPSNQPKAAKKSGLKAVTKDTGKQIPRIQATEQENQREATNDDFPMVSTFPDWSLLYLWAALELASYVLHVLLLASADDPHHQSKIAHACICLHLQAFSLSSSTIHVNFLHKFAAYGALQCHVYWRLNLASLPTQGAHLQLFLKSFYCLTRAESFLDSSLLWRLSSLPTNSSFQRKNWAKNMGGFWMQPGLALLESYSATTWKRGHTSQSHN